MVNLSVQGNTFVLICAPEHRLWVLVRARISLQFSVLLACFSGEFIINYHASQPPTCLFFVAIVSAIRKLFMFMSQSTHSECIEVHLGL